MLIKFRGKEETNICFCLHQCASTLKGKKWSTILILDACNLQGRRCRRLNRDQRNWHMHEIKSDQDTANMKAKLSIGVQWYFFPKCIVVFWLQKKIIMDSEANMNKYWPMMATTNKWKASKNNAMILGLGRVRFLKRLNVWIILFFCIP